MFNYVDFSEDITAQALAFDPVLPPDGIPEVLVQDEENVKSFIQTFKKNIGCTPSEWLKIHN